MFLSSLKKALIVFALVLFSLVSAWSDTPKFSQEFDSAVRAIGKPASIGELSKKIAGLAKTDWQKARAIYVWMTDNIDYDVDSFFNNQVVPSDADSTFSRGRAVCEGYSGLFQELAAGLGLKCEIITGFSKAFSYYPGKKMTKTDHAWNKVFVDGEWRLIDTTWGAGYVDGKTKLFYRSFINSWFFTDPRLFVFNHLPVAVDDELLLSPVLLQEFQNSPYVPTFLVNAVALPELSGDQQLQLLGTAPPELLLFIPRLQKTGLHDGEIMDLYQEKVGKDTIGQILMLSKLGFSGADLEAIPHIANLGPYVFFYCSCLVKMGYPIEEISRVVADDRLPQAFDPESAGLSRFVGPLEPEAGTTSHYEIVGKQIYGAAIVEGSVWTQFAEKDGVYSLDYQPQAKTFQIVVKLDPKKTNFSTLLAFQ